ncbi:DegV family protein [Adlercreutzia sp. ZJ141]|uniref:DegV family protein n=1 Tax=Adlercreutzia sp. ZJ141 TaxID=2709406 RepID=UPI0013EE1826|nr:DegV family protein [Adlercreutzia sp. ZJ141]
MTVRFVIDSASDMVELACPCQEATLGSDMLAGDGARAPRADDVLAGDGARAPRADEVVGDAFLPLTVAFCDEQGNREEYLDGITLSHAEFYEKLIESDELPKTSQVVPYAFEEVFERIVSAGDTAVVVTISGKLSGTYESACAAAHGYEGKVFVVDSESATIGERILIERGMHLRDQGMDAADIACALDREKRNICVLGLLDTLEYLRRGGRISAAVATAGTLLSIKPVITIEDGEVVLLGKARGSKKGNNLLIQAIEKVGGVDFSKPYALAYSGLNDDLIRKYMQDSRHLWADHVEDLPIRTVGSAIGTHVGPGAIAVAFFAKGRE